MNKMGAAVVSLILLVLAGPLLPLMLWSVANRWPWPRLLPETYSSRSWEFVLDRDSGFVIGLGWSFAIAAAVTVIALLVSLPIARVLGLYRFRGKSVIEVLVLLPLLMPAFVAAMGLHETFIHWGLTDTVSGVILIQLVPTMPYMVRTLSTGFTLIGTRLEDQARTLGAGSLRIAMSVTLPRLAHAMVAGSTFVFLASLGDYLLTVLVGGDAVPTLPLVLFPYIAAGDRPLAAVGSLLLALCPLATVLALESALANFSSMRANQEAKG